MSAASEAVGELVRDDLPLRRNATYSFRPPRRGEVFSVRCNQVKQRHWSRVGEGTLVDESGGDTRVFLKQSLGESAQAFDGLWRYELDGALLAERVLPDVIRVPRVMGIDGSHLMTAFEHVDVVPLDEMLRRDEDTLRKHFSAIMANVAEMIGALVKVEPDAAQALLGGNPVKTKRRNYASSAIALNFKGMDIRNVGLASNVQVNGGTDSRPPIVAFDFGRPYFAPVEEAGAKILVSVGLLNWGYPLRRFLRGPDERLLDAAMEQIVPYVNAAAVAEELELQRRFRTTEIHGRGPERALRRAGISVLGGRHLDLMERWCLGALPGYA